MLRSEKEQKVAALHEAFANAQLVVITHQSGMTVAQSTDLRRKMREAGGPVPRDEESARPHRPEGYRV